MIFYLIPLLTGLLGRLYICLKSFKVYFGTLNHSLIVSCLNCNKFDLNV